MKVYDEEAEKDADPYYHCSSTADRTDFIPVKGILRMILFLIPYLVIGYDILKKAGKGILNRQVFDENFLMAVATIGAIAIAIYDRSGNFNEAVAVMLFYQIGELFQSYAVGKSRKKYQ